VLVSASTIFPVTFAANYGPSYGPSAITTSSGLKAALQWLALNQSSDGSYGAYFEHWAAAAAYALWLNNTHSSKAALSYSWLTKQLSDPSWGYWGSEADVPGEVLFSVASSGNIHLLQISNVARNILQFQESNGGFFGYYSTTSLTSSVDTAEALRGLINARAINASSEQLAVNYLFTLQNLDGSFNLTSAIPYAKDYSLGPEPVSITALVLLALNDASYRSNDAHVSKALNYLSNASTKNFAVLANDTNPVYSASLSALAFNAFGRTSESLRAVSFILSHQDPDGGFRDSTSSSTGSNALYTGWAAIALQQVSPGGFFASFLRPVLIVGIMIGVLALAAIVGVVVYLVRKNRSKAMMPNI